MKNLILALTVTLPALPVFAAHYDKKQKLFDSVSPPAAHLAATGLKPEEYRLLQNYWLRRHELNLEARRRLLPELIRPILDRLGTSLASHSLPELEEHLDDLMRQARGAAPSTPPDEAGMEERA